MVTSSSLSDNGANAFHEKSRETGGAELGGKDGVTVHDMLHAQRFLSV